MGSISILVIGDDLRPQLRRHESTETEQGEFLLFIGTCEDLLLKLGCTGWAIDRLGEATAVTEGYAGSARLSDIDFDAMRRANIFESGKRWDIAHNISRGESWIPLVEIRNKYQQTIIYNKEIEDSAKLEWRAQSVLQRIEQARVFPSHYFFELQSFMDRLLLPRDVYVEYFLNSTPLIAAIDAICDGKYLRNVDVNAMLARLDASSLLTHACVKV